MTQTVFQSRNGCFIEGDPFRRDDVDYTTVAWINPVTRRRQAWSIPVELVAIFFEPVDPTLREEFDKERYKWLSREED